MHPLSLWPQVIRVWVRLMLGQHKVGILGPWLWRSWQSDRFRHQRSVVRIPTSAMINLYSNIIICQLQPRKDENKEKEAGKGPSKKRWDPRNKAFKTQNLNMNQLLYLVQHWSVHKAQRRSGRGLGVPGRWGRHIRATYSESLIFLAVTKGRFEGLEVDLNLLISLQDSSWRLLRNCNVIRA